MRKVAYYITAHGYGHGTRSCDILNALRAADPDVSMVVKTDLPINFMQSRLAAGIELRAGAFDVGLIQKDSIQVDLPASLDAVKTLYAREAELIDQEAAFMQREGVGVVVADIPAIPLAAAQKAGLPNIATGNFGWDWIYSDFIQHDPQWSGYVEKFRAVYAKTDLLLRQPFAESMAAFPHQLDLPLLAKPGSACRELIAGVSGADPAKKWVLISFTSLNLEPAAIATLERLTDYELFSVDPLRWPGSAVHCISRATASFADILASADVVLTKPGFGIVSECIANDKPIIYADREHFSEYAVLVENIQRYCRHAFIPGAELYAGELARALGEIETADRPTETVPRGGAELAARRILKTLS